MTKSPRRIISQQFMSFYEKYMTIIGTVGNFMFYVQAYEIFIHQSAKAVSFNAFMISTIGLSSWLIYGILLKNTPIIIANIVGLIGALLVLAAIYVY